MQNLKNCTTTQQFIGDNFLQGQKLSKKKSYFRIVVKLFIQHSIKKTRNPYVDFLVFSQGHQTTSILKIYLLVHVHFSPNKDVHLSIHQTTPPHSKSKNRFLLIIFTYLFETITESCHHVLWLIYF